MLRRALFFLGLTILLLPGAGLAAQPGQVISSISITSDHYFPNGTLMSGQILQITQKSGRTMLRQTDISAKTNRSDNRDYEVVTSEGVVPGKAYADLWAELESQGIWKMKPARLGYNIDETNPSSYVFSFQKGNKKNSFTDHGSALWEKYGKILKPISALFNKYAEPIDMRPAGQ